MEKDWIFGLERTHLYEILKDIKVREGSDKALIMMEYIGTAFTLNFDTWKWLFEEEDDGLYVLVRSEDKTLASIMHPWVDGKDWYRSTYSYARIRAYILAYMVENPDYKPPEFSSKKVYVTFNTGKLTEVTI